MANKNYYDILGVSSDVPEKDIKRAFKKLSLQYHPDKQANKSDIEKAEAEEKFKEINEAYQVLSDPTKRRNYDMTGDPDFGGSMHSGGFDPFNPFDIFSRMQSGNHGGFRREEPVIPGRDIRMTIPLTIEEIYSGCTKTLRFDRNVRCASCHGEGGTGKKTCKHCNGTGMEVHIERTPYGIVQQQTTCKHCHGTGMVVEKTCKTCSGSGFTTMKDTVELDIPAGIPNGNGLRVKDKGSESKSRKGATGDFIAIVVHNYDSERYVVEGNDIIEIVNLPYYDLLLGTDYVHTFPDGHTKTIHIAPCTQYGKTIRLYKEGINNDGDYFLQFHHVMPEELSDVERKALENIKVDNAKRKM